MQPVSVPLTPKEALDLIYDHHSGRFYATPGHHASTTISMELYALFYVATHKAGAYSELPRETIKTKAIQDFARWVS